MTNTQKFALKELNILEATTPDAIILPFKKEILALCEAFGKSGQSGGSAPYTASIIADVLKKLMMQEPICEVTGHENNWIDIGLKKGEPIYQNTRCSGLFKDPDGSISYINAIVWKGEEKWDSFYGNVYRDKKNLEIISSSQLVQLPFLPKTFYVDVVRVPISENNAIKRNMNYYKDENDNCYYEVVKNPKQLDQVFKHYIKK